MFACQAVISHDDSKYYQEVFVYHWKAHLHAEYLQFMLADALLLAPSLNRDILRLIIDLKKHGDESTALSSENALIATSKW